MGGGTGIPRAPHDLRSGEVPGCRTPWRGGACDRSGARGPRQAKWVDRSSPRAHKCTIGAHHWGGRAHRRRKRRHRRLHKCTIFNHHSFIRSLSRSPVRSHGSSLGREGVAGAPHSTIARSLARSPIHVSWLTTGEEGSPLGRHRRLHKRTILDHYSFVRSLARSLARQCALTAHHWEGKGLHTGRHTQPPFVARSLARQIHCHTHHRSLARSPTHVARSPLGRGR